MRTLLCLILFSSLPFAGAHAEGPKLSEERVVFHTNLGDLRVAFYPEVAPKHVAQILRLVKLGVYDGAQIFRVEKNFVAQVENFDARLDALTPEQKAAAQKLPAEFSVLPHVRGELSMARFDDPNSAETSFSIMLGAAPHLNEKYTIFGRVVGGWSTMAALDQVQIDEGNKPRTPVLILKAEVATDGQDEGAEPKQQPWALIFTAAGLIIMAGLAYRWARS